MIPHGTHGRSPEAKALDEVEVMARMRLAVVAGQRAGFTRPALLACLERNWALVEHLQIEAATEAGKHAARRRGPRGAKGVR